MASLAVSRKFPASALRLESRGVEYILRPLAVADAPKIVDAIEGSLGELKRFMPWAHAPQTLESQMERIAQFLSPTASGADFGFGLFDARNGHYLASLGLHGRLRLNPNALEIGYWVRSSEAGRGLATLGSRALIVYAFEGLGSDRVQISHNPENVASQRVVEKCGFRFEGLVRNAMPAPSPQALEAGLSAVRSDPLYALLPEDRAELPWYAELRDRIRVENALGEELGCIWRKGTAGA